MIPAKEKAAQLVLQFLPHVYCYMGSGMLTNDYDENVALINAKKCAIIAVDEILKITPRYTGGYNPTYNYWENIKTEIELIKSIDEVKEKV